MKVKTLYRDGRTLKILDQRLLPGRAEYISCRTAPEVTEAIKTLAVRGAPAIGVAAAHAIAVSAENSAAETAAGLVAGLREDASLLKASRPTAVNLSWAVDRMMEKAEAGIGLPVAKLKELLTAAALEIERQDRETCEKISENGALLLKDCSSVMTYCNAGALATAGMGTALGVIYAVSEKGRKIRVFSCETRPLLQGARLTSWELSNENIDVTLICDNTAGWAMRNGKVDAVIVGADRIAANGDSANKIGSYPLAVLARFHEIPFYVAAPLSTFDFSVSMGDDIPIEERSGEEVTSFHGRRTAPRGIKTFSPAFDVVPAELITAIITEKGVIFPPYTKNIKKAKNHEA